MSKDIRKNTKVAMNRQTLANSQIFSMRKDKVKWPTIRNAYMTDENVEQLRKLATGKGRSIVFLDGEYETKLNRYVRKDPIERAVFFEYMIKDKDIKGAIFMYCWIGNFHNGAIAHFSFQYPQVNCWLEALDNPEEFFDKAAFKVYREIVYILYGGKDKILDKEVQKFIDAGNLKV